MTIEQIRETINVLNPNVPNYISVLNSMIVDADTKAGISTGYTVTEASLSNFSQVPP